MEELVKTIPGYLSHYSHRDPVSRSGVTISYFESLEAIKTWREHPEHKEVQRLGLFLLEVGGALPEFIASLKSLSSNLVI